MFRLALLLLLAGAAAACSGSHRDDGSSASPTAPSGLSSAPASISPAPGPAPAAGARPSNLRAAAAPLPMPDDHLFPSLVSFPPRNESFEFRTALERKYATDLRRAPAPTFVDVEGDVVWMQEYLLYRVNQCGHLAAGVRVLAQILGRGIAPVCGEAPAGVVAFPPRDESLDFRRQLEQLYRDGLGRQASASAVDVEGAAVWVQEYLRYRVNRCGHVAAQAHVLAQIDGGRAAPVCAGDLSGVWRGESDFFNAPFVMDLVQAGALVRGTYTDRNDRGAVDGTVAGDRVTLRVNFGDTGHLLEGRWDGRDAVSGDFLAGGGVGRRTFEMRRQ